jgi:hypothetical protein
MLTNDFGAAFPKYGGPYKLPGVAANANLILGDVTASPAVVVDTTTASAFKQDRPRQNGGSRQN